MSKRSSRNRRQEPSAAVAPEAEPEVAGRAHSAGAEERAREQAMQARLKETRSKMSVGQANVMRLKKGNQPRGGR